MDVYVRFEAGRQRSFFLVCSISVMRLCWGAYWVPQVVGYSFPRWKGKRSLYSSDCSDNCIWPYVCQWIVLELQSKVNEILSGKRTKDRQVND